MRTYEERQHRKDMVEMLVRDDEVSCFCFYVNGQDVIMSMRGCGTDIVVPETLADIYSKQLKIMSKVDPKQTELFVRTLEYTLSMFRTMQQVEKDFNEK